MNVNDLQVGRQYPGPAGQVRELLKVSDTQKRVQYRQVVTGTVRGGGSLGVGQTRWVDTATFLGWISMVVTHG